MLSNIIFFSILIHAQTFTCVSGSIMQREYGVIKRKNLDYCFNKDKNKFFSKNCINQKCKAFERIKKYQINELSHAIGNPGFKLCRDLQGRPELLEFYAENKIYKLDRCLFKDGSFADTDSLLSFYLKR